MYAHKEIVTIDDPQRLVLKEPLPLRKGQRVEVLIVAEGERLFNKHLFSCLQSH